MQNYNNFTREEIAESLHNEFGLTKKDCIVFVNDIPKGNTGKLQRLSLAKTLGLIE